MPDWRIWVDTGGTFTDCLSINPQGVVRRLKLLSSSKLRAHVESQIPGALVVDTNWSLSKDILEGYEVQSIDGKVKGRIQSFDPAARCITADIEYKIDSLEIVSPEEVPVFACRVLTETPLDQPLPRLQLRLGSTRGTNALLEHRGAKTLLVVTKGHRDLLEIGDQSRPDLFALQIQKAQNLYADVVEVDERLAADGSVIDALASSAFDEILKASEGMESIALCLLHSYKNPQHEDSLYSMLAEAGFRYISKSSSLSPSIGILKRAMTTVVNAYLEPLMQDYIRNIEERLHNQEIKVMTSAGGLVASSRFTAKDSLLSGPAGGLVGASIVAQSMGEDKLITFDMGGTSTDVSRYDGGFDYAFETNVGRAKILSPALNIETIAAGGGSICWWDGYKFRVGPASAGADPGPACYGAGGPLTITDVDLLLGKLDPGKIPIPIDRHAAESALQKLKEASNVQSSEEILMGIEQIANEKMAKAIEKISIEKGFDPADYTLVAYGGAGGLHAAQIADNLQIRKIVIPADAGILSAYGIGMTSEQAFIEHQILQDLDALDIEVCVTELEEKLLSNPENAHMQIFDRWVYLRFRGQENSIEISYNSKGQVRREFEEKYKKLFQHWNEAKIEVVSIRIAAGEYAEPSNEQFVHPQEPLDERSLSSLVDGEWQEIRSINRFGLVDGDEVTGPLVLNSATGTTFLPRNWRGKKHSNELVLERYAEEHNSARISNAALISLYTNRFTSVVEEMGALMQRTAFSVNIRERLDFSCGLLDGSGYLIVNAPHIPVHLGGLGVCVRKVLSHLEIEEGDVVITNHPGFGGSHLPDVTLIAPVFASNERIGFVANRAHHAEIGGSRPGSMPPEAKSLEEEGVAISPTYLVRNGKPRWDAVEEIFNNAKYPSRSVADNLADLRAALASIRFGLIKMEQMANQSGGDVLKTFMEAIRIDASQALETALKSFEGRKVEASEYLDQGEEIHISLEVVKNQARIDFSASSPVAVGNCHATEAIVYSTVLYVLRLLCDREIPLNEGMLEHISLNLPTNFLNPEFPEDPSDCPPVVGGNTETSQRLVDTLLKAFGVAACSQGTMNNLLFGNDTFGYYETICGGVGATKGTRGASAIHQHMTNTRITDPEVLEWKYPVQLEEFSIRSGSGGTGKWHGGDGVTRRIRFLENMAITIISQHRNTRPYGLEGGKDGACGNQWIEENGQTIELEGIDMAEVKKGSVLTIETPGGGGFGSE